MTYTKILTELNFSGYRLMVYSNMKIGRLRIPRLFTFTLVVVIWLFKLVSANSDNADDNEEFSWVPLHHKDYSNDIRRHMHVINFFTVPCNFNFLFFFNLIC